jgi:hypothetical protein
MLQAVSTETRVVKVPSLFRRLFRRDAAPTGASSGRPLVHPPGVWGQAEPVWKALWTWLRAGPGPDERRASSLETARHDFAAALADLNEPDAHDLRRRGQSARSLRELWHLRADLYSIVARYRSQAEADRRLQHVNRHFPTRTQTVATTGTRPGRGLDD